MECHVWLFLMIFDGFSIVSITYHYIYTIKAFQTFFPNSVNVHHQKIKWYAMGIFWVETFLNFYQDL